jgi:CubicO group peptidase (beta-lactamase class C family)
MVRDHDTPSNQISRMAAATSARTAEHAVAELRMLRRILHFVAVDLVAIRQACSRQAARETEGIAEIEKYLGSQVRDESNREVLGPLLAGSGASGVIMYRGEVVGSWGDPHIPEMLFSATKAFVGLVAGVAYDRGQLDVQSRVGDTVDLEIFDAEGGRDIRWTHLLQQTSQWKGILWGKPTWIDAQSHPEASEPEVGSPGSQWAYNDVRVNLLCLALTALLGQALPDVLGETIMRPIGASSSWSWHGYTNSSVEINEYTVPVASGGAHWGGGLWMSAADLALVGQLYLQQATWKGQQRLLSADWIAQSWSPCDIKPEYGYLWWLNDRRTIFPQAPSSGRCARGTQGRHILWVDPARDLVVTSHWGNDVGQLLAEVSAAVTTQPHD